MRRTVQSLYLPGPAGKLEALWENPASPRSDLVGLACHPHPLFGGTMHNKVVHHTARALQGLGLAVLRFNFRGAGSSQGTHDKGRGEAEDVRAALAWLEEKAPGAKVVLAGFSFGSWVGLRVGCADNRVKALVGVGIPANDSDFSYLAACAKPKLFVQGSRDQYGSRENVEALLTRAPDPKKLVWIDSADHFFAGKLDELRKAITANLPALSGL